jgi:hypothetical protein
LIKGIAEAIAGMVSESAALLEHGRGRLQPGAYESLIRLHSGIEQLNLLLGPYREITSSYPVGTPERVESGPSMEVSTESLEDPENAARVSTNVFRMATGLGPPDGKLGRTPPVTEPETVEEM